MAQLSDHMELSTIQSKWHAKKIVLQVTSLPLQNPVRNSYYPFCRISWYVPHVCCLLTEVWDHTGSLS